MPGDLHQAADVAREDGDGAGGEDILRLAITQFRGHVGLSQVVTPGRSATEFRLVEPDEFETGDRLQQRTRLLLDLLGVPQVAGVVVGRFDRQAVRRRHQPERIQELGNVLHLRLKLHGVLGRRRGVQQVGIVLEHRPAPGRIRDDRVQFVPLRATDAERRAVLGRERPGLAFFAAVVVQRPAAALALGNPNIAAVGLEHLGGRVVRLRIQPVGDAPEEQPDFGPAWPDGREQFGQTAVVPLQWWQHPVHGLQRFRQQPEQSRFPHQPIEAGPLRQPGRGQRQPGADATVENAEEHLPLNPRHRPRAAARVQMFHVFAERFDEFAVLHAGRAGGLAGPAVQAKIEVALHGVVEFEDAVDHLAHEVNAAARGIGFVSRFHVSRARRGAQPAVDAIEDEFVIDVRFGRGHRQCGLSRSEQSHRECRVLN